MLAKQAATLDQLSGGRFELGLGAGAFWDAIRAMGGPVREPKEALAALREAIALIRDYWSGQTLRHNGEIYQAVGARPGPLPAHDIGIWLGVIGPRALRLTGELADGWVPSMSYVPPAQAAQVERDHRRGGARRRARSVRDPPHLQHRRRRRAGRRGGRERRRPADRRAARALGQCPDPSGGRSRLLDVRALGRADRAAPAHVHRGDRAGGEGASGGGAGS